ncbi:MAG: ABC transporter permease [Lachnospiraceae bacterium]|nr:ABC transporter permease [Lachnospiraceae bacterium]MDO4529243.1 ABC transporter permease [Lachnospiraceae bacterium]
MAERKSFIRQYAPSFAPILGLILVVAVFGILSGGRMFTLRNAKMIINQIFPIIICSIGAVFYWAWGVFDLAVAGILGCTTIFTAIIINTGHMWLALIVAIIVACAFCVASSFVGTFSGIPIFLASLCFMFITNGILTAYTNKHIILILGDFDKINTMPVKLTIIVVVGLVCWFLFNFTALGKACRLMGGNEKAAKFSGIKVNKIKIISFIIAGVCIGIASFFLTMRIGKVDYQTGSGVQFDVITALVFGGMPFGGGRHARISNAVIGSFTYIMLSNGMQLAGIPYNFIDLVNGVVFLIVVYLSFPRSKDKLLP